MPTNKDIERALQAPHITKRRHKLEPGKCEYCDFERAVDNDYHPSHDPSSRCESGKRSHCTCDTCF